MEFRDQSEVAIQSKAYVNLWNNRPDLRGRVFAINNNSQNSIKGALNKSMGVLPGVADMAFIRSNGAILWIEWKTQLGSQSKQQKEWEHTITQLGHEYVIVRSEDEFLSVIDKYND
ncbi:hypothetical protein [Pedobacter punctiformis]|uniref:VRR-NUC domain-containing protein n=1 Tax=Pedobacter punctiformis TaxID=3004097 RepID=A0ABT4LAK2_9SPHI|nr:hypothetical protein [Pedobacter sp. HCMS5-2]MCZ4244940.1 hypothetical protein [Pedobacter sp. HCMS5-2]